MSSSGDVTQLLHAYREGDREAFDRLVPLVYDDLRRIARRQLRGQRGETLNTTGLVHEAWLKIAENGKAGYEDRGHFMAVSAVAMRQVVITYARKHAAAKRGGGLRPVTLEEGRVAIEQHAEQLLSIDQALTRLAGYNERLARVFEARFFAGLSEEETATALDSSLRTVQRDWKRARAWLKEELGGEG